MSINKHQAIFWLSIAVLIIVGSGCLLFFVPSATSQSPSLLDSSIAANDLIMLTNEIRDIKQLQPLTVNDKLNAAAQAKATDLIANNFFSHNAPDGSFFSSWIDDVGYDYQIIGENLAAGFTTNKDVMKAWMDSSGHRANILNDKYREIGLAVIMGKLQGQQQVVVVQIFGSPRKLKLSEMMSDYNNSYQAFRTLPITLSII
ncbi:MAG: CAP domain-containing protein [Candidatus Komeilibacteria bacterium]